jgi:hypothetical protein
MVYQGGRRRSFLARRPLAATQSLHGIPREQVVELLVWYLSAPPAWYEAVPEAAGVRDNGDNFPLCTTFALYHPETVNMMADLAAWCVLSSSEKFLSFARG